MSNKGRIPPLDYIPLEQIEEAAKSFAEVLIIPRRRNAKGQLATLSGCHRMRMPTLELKGIEGWCEERGGGGEYEIEVQNAMDGEPTHPIPPFKFRIEGGPKPSVGQQPLGVGPNPGLPFMGPAVPTPSGPLPMPAQKWAAGLAPADQAAYYQGAQMYPPYGYPPPQPAPGASIPSDRMAYQQAMDTRAELEKERAERKAAQAKMEEERKERERREAEDRRLHEKEMAELRAMFERERAEHQRQLEEERRRAAEQRQIDREAAMRAEFKAQMDAQHAALLAKLDKPAQDPAQSMFAVIAKMQSDRDAQTQAMQLEMAKLSQSQQQQMMGFFQTMMSGSSKSEQLMMEMMKQNSPESRASLLDTLMNTQVTQMGAMMQMMEAMAGPEKPVWFEPMMNGLDTMKNIVGAWLSGDLKGPPPQPVQARVLPPQAQPQQLSPQYPPVFQSLDAPPQQAPLVTPAPSNGANGKPDEAAAAAAAAAEARFEQLAAVLPQDFRTPAWKKILIALHATAPVEEVASLFLQQLDYLLTFDALPGALSGLLADPQGTLVNLMRFMPIYRENRDYCEAVTKAVVLAIKQSQAEGQAEEEAEEPEEDPPQANA